MRSFRRLSAAGLVLAAAAAGLVAIAGSAGAVLANPASIAFGPVPVGDFAVQNVVLTPDPGYDMRVITNFEPTFVTLGDDCDFNSNPCTAQVEFTPPRVGDFTGKVGYSECLTATGDGCIDITVTTTGTGVEVGTGTAAAVPANPVPGGQFVVESVTPCPRGSAEVAYELEAPDGNIMQASNVPLSDSAGSWTITLTAPTTRGLYTFFASCLNYGLVVQNYTPVSISIGATTTTVSATPNPVDFGQPTTVTATVAFVSPGATPTGSVTFTDGTTTLGTVTTTGGVATLNTSTLALGTHHIVASYTGTGLSSTGSTDVVIRQAPTALQAGSVRRAVGGNTFSAVLTSDATPVAGQTVSFTAPNVTGRQVLQCTATTDSHGVASCHAANQVQVALATTYQASFNATPQYRASTVTARFTY